MRKIARVCLGCCYTLLWIRWLKKQIPISPSCGGWEVSDPDASRIGFWLLLCRFPPSHRVPTCRKSELRSLCLLISLLMSPWDPPSWPLLNWVNSQRPHPQIPSCWRLGIQHRTCGRTQIFTPQQLANCNVIALSFPFTLETSLLHWSVWDLRTRYASANHWKMSDKK